MEAYSKNSKVVTQYGYDTPLKTRLGKSASDYRIDDVQDKDLTIKSLVETVSQLSAENIRLQEQTQYLCEVIEELREGIRNLDNLV